MSEKTTVSLGAALDIMHVSSLKERLLSALSKKSHIVLISDKVERADTAGLQLIYAFKQEIDKQSKQMSWQKPTDTLIAASRNLGLDEQLGLN